MLLGKLSKENKELFLDFELCLANADGNISDVEKHLIDSHCFEMGLSNNEYIAKRPLNEVIKQLSSFTANEKRIAYMELVSLAFVDNEYTEEEKQFIENSRVAFGLSANEAEQAESIVGNLIRCTMELEKFAGI